MNHRPLTKNHHLSTNTTKEQRLDQGIASMTDEGGATARPVRKGLTVVLLVVVLALLQLVLEKGTTLKGDTLASTVPWSKSTKRTVTSSEKNGIVGSVQYNNTTAVTATTDATNSSASPTRQDRPVPKIYVYPDNLNPTGKKPSRIYFELEETLLTAMRARGRIVEDPTEATHFWVPHALVAHWIAQGRKVQHFPYDIQAYLDETLRPFLKRMYYEYPYFNHSQGHDHIFVHVYDNSPFCSSSHGASLISRDPFFQMILRPMKKVGYFGIRQTQDKRTGIPCWDDNLDIALPQWHSWNMTENPGLTQAAMNCPASAGTGPECDAWADYLQARANQTKAAFFFRGTVVKGSICSKGIRPWLESYCRSHGVCLFNEGSIPMENAVFAFSPAGWGCWSSRLYDAFYRLTIPVVLADNMVLPFEQQLNYDIFLERVETGQPTNLTDDGGPAFVRLLQLAQSWMEVCQNVTLKEDCLSHPVSLKMNSMARYRHYFGWGMHGNGNAFALFEHELMKDYTQVQPRK